MIYGLDLSIASTGVAIYDTKKEEIVHLHTIRTLKVGNNTPQRLRHIREEFQQLIKQYPPIIVAIEQGFIRHNKASQQIFRVFGIVEELFADYPIYHYTPNTVKKTSTGNGRSKKQQVRESVENVFDVKANNYDESDAIAVVLTHLTQGGEIDG